MLKSSILTRDRGIFFYFFIGMDCDMIDGDNGGMPILLPRIWSMVSWCFWGIVFMLKVFNWFTRIECAWKFSEIGIVIERVLHILLLFVLWLSLWFCPYWNFHLGSVGVRKLSNTKWHVWNSFLTVCRFLNTQWACLEL